MNGQGLSQCESQAIYSLLEEELEQRGTYLERFFFNVSDGCHTRPSRDYRHVLFFPMCCVCVESFPLHF